MIFLVFLGNSIFKFDNSEDAVSFLEKAKFFYYRAEKPIFTLEILTLEEFDKFEKEILQREEEKKVLKEKGLII